MRSMMSCGISKLVCLTILAGVTFGDNKKPEPVINAKEDFIVGELTPVWLAANPNDGNQVVYSRLPYDIMKTSMTWFKKTDRKTIKLDPFIDAYSSIPDKDVLKRASDDAIYLSILVVNDYRITLDPSKSPGEQKIIIESLIPYAMSFWKSVELGLKALEHKVKIRISGLIIGKDREATPYIWDNYSPTEIFDEESAILSMHEHWENLAATQNDFRKSAYDCVVTLTDLKPKQVIKYDFDQLTEEFSKKRFKILSFMATDDRLYSGVTEVTDKLIEIINQFPSRHLVTSTTAKSTLSTSSAKRPYLQFQYFDTNVKQFYDGLSKAKDYHNPGKPLDPILPAHLTPELEQCKIRAKGDFKPKRVCWVATSCSSLMCANSLNQCRKVGIPIDGTKCDDEKICLAGSCVSSSVFEYNANLRGRI